MNQSPNFETLLTRYLAVDPASKVRRTWAAKCAALYMLMSAPAQRNRAPLPTPLARWVTYQRGHQHLSDLQMECLEAIPGWSWDPREDGWSRQLLLVRNFMETHGRTPRRNGYLQAESKLGYWLKRCRVLERDQMLAAHRKDELDKLPLPWK